MFLSGLLGIAGAKATVFAVFKAIGEEICITFYIDHGIDI